MRELVGIEFHPDGLFDGSGVSEVKYEDTEHYAVTRDFLNNYPRRLEQLLADND